MKTTKIIKSLNADSRTAASLKTLVHENPMNSLELLRYLSSATLSAVLWDVQVARVRLCAARARTPSDRDLATIQGEITELLHQAHD